MPVNFLLIESLQKFHHYYGDDFKIECPTGSGKFMTINEVADELSRRLARLFLKGKDGQRPVLKYHPKLATDPHFKDYVLFHEYFHGDNGRGVGASHQTGWTGLVAKLLPEILLVDPAPPAAGARVLKGEQFLQERHAFVQHALCHVKTDPGEAATLLCRYLGCY